MCHRKCWGKLKDAATRCVLRPVDASKCVCDLVSARTPLGELTALPQTPLLDLGREIGRGWKGLCREGERKWKERKGREKEKAE